MRFMIVALFSFIVTIFVSTADSKPLTVCLVSGALEYKSDETLNNFQKELETKHGMRCTCAFRKADDDLPGLENLESCDVMLLFTRRLSPKPEQLEHVKRYLAAGKPVVAVRTASHAFQNWLELDKEVLGGNYQGHHKVGPVTEVKIVEVAKDHPLLRGVRPFVSKSSLYKNSPLAMDTTPILTGSIPSAIEPVAWFREHKGGRVFTTSLGSPDDFQNENFRRMVINALNWTAKR